MGDLVASAVSSAIGTHLSESISSAVEKAVKTPMPPPQPPTLQHFPLPPTSTPYPFSPAHSFNSPTPELPDLFLVKGGTHPASLDPLWPQGHLPIYFFHLVGRPPSLSPTRQRLRPCEEVVSELSDWLAPGRVGKLAIKLAKECVYRADVAVQEKLSQEGLHHIRYTLRFVSIKNGNTYYSLQPPSPRHLGN